jgi:hypothetical protein
VLNNQARLLYFARVKFLLKKIRGIKGIGFLVMIIFSRFLAGTDFASRRITFAAGCPFLEND